MGTIDFTYGPRAIVYLYSIAYSYGLQACRSVPTGCRTAYLFSFCSPWPAPHNAAQHAGRGVFTKAKAFVEGYAQFLPFFA